MFTVLCCAHLYGEKVNLEVSLPAFPASLVELEEFLHVTFQTESAALAGRPEDQLPFRIAAIQWYDDALLQWSELVSLDQLHEYDQLYIFQPQSRLHQDVQQDLPPPRLPLTMPALSTSQLPTTPTHQSKWPAQQGASPPVYSPTGDAGRVQSAQVRTGELSPSARQLMERAREEASLVERLSRLREEKMALERSVQAELEAERRQLAAQTDIALKQKEEQIWQQRDRLAQAEQDFQALLERKQQLLSSHMVGSS